MPTASLALPDHQAWMSQGPAWGSAILGPAGRSRIVIGGHRPAEEGPTGNLAMRNRSMFRHATLYAVIFLCLSIAAAPLVLLALFFF
jgi:hypothetical protein